MANKAFTTELKIEGAKELAAILRELPQRSVETATKQAVNAGATPVLKATRAAAPVESGLLQKGLTKKTKYFKSSATAISIIGESNEVTGVWKGRTRKPSKYWHLVLHGTKNSSANDFRARAVESSKTTAADKMSQKMAQAVQRQADRLKRG